MNRRAMSTPPRTGSKRIYYPFWAAGASASALDRSSGGPSAEGATLVHWLVAAGTVVVSYVVIRSMERLAGKRGWGPREKYERSEILTLGTSTRASTVQG
jgi:hypothetical protein